MFLTNQVQTERDLRFQLEELEKQLRCKECLITDLEMRYDCAMKTAEASEQQQANKLSLAYQQVNSSRGFRPDLSCLSGFGRPFL